MRWIGIVGRLFLITLFALFIQKVSCQTGFTIYKSWDFESQTIDNEFSDDEIASYMGMIDMIDYSGHIMTQIVTDKINGASTKVMRIKHEPGIVWHGWGGNIPLDKGYNEIYCNYNWKFSNEFNSTSGGKLPGLIGLPYKFESCPSPGQGFSAINLFKYAGFMTSYHYDNTYQNCPWGTDEDSVVMSFGTWYNITQRLVMNSFTNGVANPDGIKEVWIDGKLILQEKNLKIVTDINWARIDGFRLAHFYGGSGFNYTPQTECYGYIDNIKIYIPIDDPTIGTYNIHDPNKELTAPNPITDRRVYYDKLVTESGPLNNSQFGSIYSPCIDEAYLIDAGEGNKVNYNLNWGIGGGDYLFFYDGNRSDSKLIKIVRGSTSSSNQTIESSGRYLFVRFSSNTDIGSTGFNGTLTFVQGNDTEIIPPTDTNDYPSINNQEFVIREHELADNFIGKIIAYDTDPGQKLAYAITSGNNDGLFNLSNLTGDLKVTRNDVFDAGSVSRELIVKVTDNGQDPKSSSATIVVSFVDESSLIYIDPENRNDPSENGSILHPFDSWQDVVFTEGNSYLQKRGTTAVLDKILLGADNISLGAYGEGELPVIEGQTSLYLISGFERRNITLSDLHIKGENAVSCIYILGNSSDNITVDHCILEGASNAIRIVDGKTFTIKYNTITSEFEGIATAASTSNIYYNIFKNNQTAVNVINNTSSANIYNNIFVDNVESVSTTYGELTLYNNIFYMTGSDQQAIVAGSDHIVSDHNIFYPEQNGFIEISGVKYNDLDRLQQELSIDINSFTSDPAFVDLYAENFTLKGSSPAINAGINLNLGSDYFGVTVPNAGVTDIGISEFTGAVLAKFGQNSPEPVMNIYPNPSSGLVNIDIEMGEDVTSETLFESVPKINRLEVKIVDMHGKTLAAKFIEHTGSIIQEHFDLTGIANGLYFIVFQLADNTFTKKLVLNR